jgi:hypothetical protein
MDVVMQCERCGAGPAGVDLFDWCGLCGQTLCDLCMSTGCCGQGPAISGRTQDVDRPPVSWEEPAPPKRS